MAAKTIYFGVSRSWGSYIQGKIELSSASETSSNTSDVTASIYVHKADHDGPLTTPTTGTWPYSITVNGSKRSGSVYTSVLEDWVLLYSGAWNDIAHGSDGSKSISVSGSVSAPDGTAYAGHTSSGSDTFELDTIPRASSIRFAGNTSLGSECNVKWVPKAASFRYKLQFSLGRWKLTTGAIHPNTTSEYAYTGYTFPYYIANQLPDTSAGIMNVTLYTYSDSAASELVGKSSSSFWVTIPDNSTTKPSVSLRISDADGLPSEFDGLYIQSKSRVQGDLDASGQYDATISDLKMNVGGVPYDSPFLSGILDQPGQITITAIATDSRGFSQSTKEIITVQAYSKPQVAVDICERCDSSGTPIDSGTRLRVKAYQSWSQIGGRNLCALRFRWRLASVGDSGYSNWITLLDRGSSGNTYDAVIPNIVFDAKQSYVVQIGVVDDIGEAVANTQTITSEYVQSHESRDGYALGMYRSAGGFEVAWPSHFYGNVDGRVLALGELPQIPSGANLDDYLEPGVWGVTSASGITNWPSKFGGTVTVKYADGFKIDNGLYFYVTQIVDDYTCQHRYVRTFHTSALGDVGDITQWYQVY